MAVYHHGPGDTEADALRRRSYQALACSLFSYCGSIALYCARGHLEEDLEVLAAEGFDIRRLDVQKWAAEPAALHQDLKTTLDFPDYYGENLDALAECLKDALDIEDDGGMVVVFENADEVRREFLERFLGVFVDAARHLQFFGKTLLLIVHSKDPRAEYGPLGAIRARWNPKEFLSKNRGTE